MVREKRKRSTCWLVQHAIRWKVRSYSVTMRLPTTSLSGTNYLGFFSVTSDLFPKMRSFSSLKFRSRLFGNPSSLQHETVELLIKCTTVLMCRIRTALCSTTRPGGALHHENEGREHPALKAECEGCNSPSKAHCDSYPLLVVCVDEVHFMSQFLHPSHFCFRENDMRPTSRCCTAVQKRPQC